MTEDEILELWEKDLQISKWHTTFLCGQNELNASSFDHNVVREILPWSDVAAADDLSGRLENYLTYITSTNTWYAWDGRVHTPLDGDSFAIKVCTAYHKAFSRTLSIVEDVIDSKAAQAKANGAEEKEVKAVKDEYKKGFERQRNYRDKIANNQGFTSLMKTLRVNCTKDPDQYINDQDYLVVKNYVLNLKRLREGDKTNFVEKHNPKYPVTRYMDVDYRPDLGLNDSLWTEFLDSSVKDYEDKEEVISHLQQIVGASFMGMSKLRTVPNFVGPPSSGKSLFVETLWKMGKGGSGYCVMPSSSAITKTSGTNFEQDAFRGNRFIAISEPPSKDEIDDDFIKRFTGDASMSTRTLHSKSSEWAPQGALFISSNHTLRINSRDTAIVERIEVIDFPYRFIPNPSGPMEKERDTQLSEKLMREDEKSKILNWIVLGMLDFIENDYRLIVPKSIKEKQKDVVSVASAPLRWIVDQMDEGVIANVAGDSNVQANAYLTVSGAYRMFQIWCAEAGERTTAKRFFEEDVKLRFPIVKYNGEKQFKNLMMTSKARQGNSAPRIPTTV